MNTIQYDNTSISNTVGEKNEADKRTMEISSIPIKPGAPDTNGKVADDVTVEK